MAGLGVDRADDPVAGDPPGDPDPAVVPFLEILAEHRGEEGRRLPEGCRDGFTLEREKERLSVPGERVDERCPRSVVLPVGGGLATGAVVVVPPENSPEG
jgi:hypothetical protein